MTVLTQPRSTGEGGIALTPGNRMVLRAGLAASGDSFSNSRIAFGRSPAINGSSDLRFLGG